MFRLALLMFSFVMAAQAFSQDFSNKGKDFWIAYPSHIDGTGSVMGIYITSDVNATGTIQVGPTATIPFTVTANQVTRKFLGSTGTMDASNSYVYLTSNDGIKTNAAIRITADKPVVAYTHIIRSARSGATLALPTSVLGTEYIAPSHRNYGSSQSYGEIAVVATQPATEIEVTPTIAGVGGRPANVPFKITLANAGDVYQFQGLRNGDVSGTRIKSVSVGTNGCKPIAVFAATTWSAFDCSGAGGGDNLYQQLFPLTTWGKKFITAPFINRPYDIYKIYVNDITTQVTVSTRGVPALLTSTDFDAIGKFYTVETADPLYIEADKPISVVQFIISQNCKTGCGSSGTQPTSCLADPEMVLLNPIEQTLSDVTFFSAHRNFVPPNQTSISLHYVNIIINKNFKSTVKIDNAAIAGSSFTDIQNSNYAYLQYDLTSSSATNPVHRVTADTSFSAIVYGYGNVESYGYNGGTNVRDLYQYVTLQNQFASVNFPATCKNTPFNFAITLPYLPTSLTWDFGNHPNLSPNTTVVNNSPSPDSSFVRDGRTLYLFKLPALYSFSKEGTYNVKVLAVNPSPDGCSGLQEINYDVQVFEPPKADFTIGQTGCVEDTVKFSDVTDGLGRPINKWLWSFSDNTIDTVKNPVKKFSVAGTDTIRLRAITDVGCVADTFKNITTSSRPVAKFNASGIFCPGSPIGFTDSSVVASGSIKTWHWKFGNGNTHDDVMKAAPAQLYASANTYTSSLIVESNTGCSSLVATKPIIINQNPVVDFSLANVCLPAGVAKFKNLTTSASGAANTYLWNFGDGGFDTATNPVHIYTAAGPYQVSLKATSPFGCVHDSTKTFTNIYAEPIAAFTHSPAEVCLPDTMRFTDGSTAAGSTVSEWFWDFGDGTTSNLQNPSKKWNASGNYKVRLFVGSGAGCFSDTLEKQVVVNALPTAVFNVSSPVCEGRDVTFTNLSNPNAGNITSYFWSFGDSTTSTSGASSITHNYLLGTYTIALAVATDKGCESDTVYKTVKVNPVPAVNFILPRICLSDAFASFTDSSFISDGSASSFIYTWKFGDANASVSNPNTSSLANPQHRYSAAANYDVSLTVTSNAGCAATLSKVFTVNGAVPTAAFDVVNSGNLCSNTAVGIRNTSTVDFGSVTRLEIVWDNKNSPALVEIDTIPSANKFYSHSYSTLLTTSNYEIEIRAYSGGSCVNESAKTITVKGSPKVVFPAPAEFCLNEPSRQLSLPANGGLPGAGSFSGKGITSSGNFTPANAGAGLHQLKYVYTSTEGCKDSAQATAVVHPFPIVNAGADRYVLEGDQLELQPQVFGNDLSYLWSPSQYLINPTIPNTVSKPLADIIYTLTVIGRGGCKASDNMTVKVLKTPGIPNAFSPNGDGINDTWKIMHLEAYPAATVEIFDRYGRQVLMSYGYRASWDGTFNGKHLPVGTYYYIINPKNGRQQYSGSVTILK